MNPPTVPWLALVRDLLFSSKITAAARQLGVSVKVLRDPGGLALEAGAGLLVDLNQPGTIEAAVQWKQRSGGRVIGFVSHVDGETIARAREAGIDQIFPRGQFTQLLPNLLQNPPADHQG